MQLRKLYILFSLYLRKLYFFIFNFRFTIYLSEFFILKSIDPSEDDEYNLFFYFTAKISKILAQTFLNLVSHHASQFQNGNFSRTCNIISCKNINFHFST